MNTFENTGEELLNEINLLMECLPLVKCEGPYDLNSLKRYGAVAGFRNQLFNEFLEPKIQELMQPFVDCGFTTPDARRAVLDSILLPDDSENA